MTYCRYFEFEILILLARGLIGWREKAIICSVFNERIGHNRPMDMDERFLLFLQVSNVFMAIYEIFCSVKRAQTS